jgi:hypothetical protein
MSIKREFTYQFIHVRSMTLPTDRDKLDLLKCFTMIAMKVTAMALETDLLGVCTHPAAQRKAEQSSILSVVGDQGVWSSHRTELLFTQHPLFNGQTKRRS